MDLHKIVQPIGDFENMQVPITPIVKKKLLALQIWLQFLFFIKIYDCKNKKIYVWLEKPKTYMSHEKFDLKSILHRPPPMANIGGQNLMGVLKMDELFDKLNTKGELKIENDTLMLQLCLFLFPHNYSK